MTIDNYGQGLIDFSEVFPAKNRRRTSECVPAERVKVWRDVRQICGIKYKDIAANSDFSISTTSKILNLNRPVCLEDFERLKSVIADLLAEKILASVNGGRRP